MRRIRRIADSGFVGNITLVAAMIKIENVSVSFGQKQVLSELDLSLDQQKIAIIGSNGSGKSTFSRLLNGLLLPTTGRVVVDGLDTATDGKTIRKKVGFVFQNPDNQIVMPIVEEDLAFGLKNLGLSKSEVACRIDKILSQYALENQRKQSAYLLSGGQKQLMAICGILVMEPQIIILDEPTTQLDLQNKKKIFKIIHELKQKVIVVSHDLQLMEQFDRILVFDRGQVVCDDEPKHAIAFYQQLMS